MAGQVIECLALSRGIAVGRVAFLRERFVSDPAEQIAPDAIAQELKRFESALESARTQLEELPTGSYLSSGVADIFTVQLAILSSSSLTQEVRHLIEQSRMAADAALRAVCSEHTARQAEVGDESFKDKAADIEDACLRVITAMHGEAPLIEPECGGSVVVAKEFRPSSIVELARGGPAALVSERGGWTSHAAIVARELRLPMVAGVRAVKHLLKTGQSVLVDGDRGKLIIDPPESTAPRRIFVPGDIRASDTPNQTQSSFITVRANIDSHEGYATAKDAGAQGIGLFRSELMIRVPGVVPDEQQQVIAYAAAADAAGDDGVNIRSFDCGPDLLLGDGASNERNPALGLRGLRLSFLEEKQFRRQVRAILKASAGRNIRIVLPMVAGVQDIAVARSVIAEERAAVLESGAEAGDPPIGAMIELPAAVLTAEQIAKQVDLVCLGTNDLAQYLLAVDRDNDAVAEYYQSLHPAVLLAIRTVIDACRSAGTPLTICGEMAGSAFYVPLLLGLGARELSMSVSSIPLIKRLISRVDPSDAEKLSSEALAQETAIGVEELLRHHYSTHWPDLFRDHPYGPASA
jgi:phosphoenolpyruvate-protein phosphotransferase (PTS system enzyme I)